MSKYSTIIAGTMTWGQWGKQLPLKEMAELQNFCLNEGITTFDHADIYGDYTTETEFGKAFIESKINRDKVQFISKCGIQLVGNSRQNTVKHYNYSKEYIIWSVEQSLKNLKTDYLDALLLHRPSPLMQSEEIASAIFQLKKEGKVLNFGVSNFTPSQVDLINYAVPVAINQIEFSLTNFEAMNNGVLDQMILRNMIPMAWSPLGKVFREKTEQTDRILTVLNELSKKYNATPSQLLIAWTLKHPSKIKPIIGTTNKGRILKTIKAQDIELELEDWFKLLKASDGSEIA